MKLQSPDHLFKTNDVAGPDVSRRYRYRGERRGSGKLWEVPLFSLQHYACTGMAAKFIFSQDLMVII
jgi:hypothetical protein